MRNALIVEVQPDQLGNLSFLAGMLVGLGRPEAEVLKQILDSLQMVEVDDDFGNVPEGTEPTETGGEDLPPLGEVVEFPGGITREPTTDDIDFTPDNPGVEMSVSPDEARMMNRTPNGYPLQTGAGPIPDGGELG